MLVSCAIASSGRQTLVRCLRSLAALDLPENVTFELIIADDSRDSRVPGLVEKAGQMPFPVRIVASNSGNVAIARNACLAAATGELVAFVDDDEWVPANWLQRLLAAMNDFEADCVFGPVHPVYPEGTPDWIVRANPLHVDWGKRGHRVTIGRSGNTLFRRAIAVDHNLRFDPLLGKTGGEDTSFFHAFGKAGGAMVVTDDAMVREDAPPARVNLAYFRHRALRTGQMYARFILRHEVSMPLPKLVFYGGACAKAIVAFGAGTACYPFDRALWLRFMMRAWMNTGKIRELLRLEPSVMI